MRRQSFTTKARAHHRLIDDGSEYRVPRWSCFPEGEPPTYEELLEADIRRKRLLSMARNLSPIDTVARIGLIGRTVVPRILRHGVCWFVLAVYFLATLLARTRAISLATLGDDAADGLAQPGRVVTFMIIFYVSCE